MAPEHIARPDSAAPAPLARANLWHRAYRRFHRFLFEQEPGFLPTFHGEVPDAPLENSRRESALADQTGTSEPHAGRDVPGRE